jgi:hypothetical protein
MAILVRPAKDLAMPHNAWQLEDNATGVNGNLPGVVQVS